MLYSIKYVHTVTLSGLWYKKTTTTHYQSDLSIKFSVACTVVKTSHQSAHSNLIPRMDLIVKWFKQFSKHFKASAESGRVRATATALGFFTRECAVFYAASGYAVLVYESVETESQPRHFSWLIASVCSPCARMIAHVNANANHVCVRSCVTGSLCGRRPTKTLRRACRFFADI